MVPSVMVGDNDGILTFNASEYGENKLIRKALLE
jgi:hypothetical protein